MTRYFFIGFILTVCVAGGFGGGNYGLTLVAGETDGYAAVAALQQEDHDVVFGPIFNNDHASYKDALYRLRKSGVAVLGSSRALEYRQVFFSEPITNCGRMVYDVYSAMNVLKEMAADDFTHTVLVIADYWWFKGPFNEGNLLRAPRKSDGTERTYKMFYQPAVYMLEGKVSLGKVIGAATDRKRIGLHAISTGLGFTFEGAIRREPQVYSSPPSYEEMRDRLAVRGGKGRFAYGRDFHPGKVEALMALEEDFRKAGKELIVVLTPVSPALYEALQTDERFSYALKATDYAGSKGAYDYLAPGILNAGTDQFVDFFHEGPKSSARVLLDLARRDERVARIVDRVGAERFLAAPLDRDVAD